MTQNVIVRILSSKRNRIIIALLLLIFLPIIMYALQTQTFELRKKAATSEPIPAPSPTQPPQPSMPPTPTPMYPTQTRFPTQSCYDTDGGNNYYTYGFVRYTSNPYGVLEEADVCDGSSLTERVCNSQTQYTQNFVRYDCPYGCSNGICRYPPTPTLSPSPTPTPVASSCSRTSPTISIATSNTTVKTGIPFYATYTITNNDSTTCTSEYFTLNVYDSLTQTPITRNLLLQPGASSSETVSFYIPYAVYSHPTAPSISASLIGNIERYSYKDIRSYTLPIQVMAPIAYDFTMFLRLEGVADGGAQGAKTIFRFVSNEKNLVTPPVSLAHIGEGIYQARFSVSSAQIPPGKGYTLYVKPEKHLSKKFCKISLQDQACLPGESFSLPEPIAPIIFTLSRFPIEAGDLYPQDNKADLTDFDKIKSLLSKPCGSLTDQEKLTGDLDYNGCVNIRDAFLMRKALETRYDEN